MIGGLEHLLYKDRLRAGALQSLKGAYREAGEGLFIRAYSNRTRRNGFKLGV